MSPLPEAAQLAPINGIVAHDFDKDGITDLILGGGVIGDGRSLLIGKIQA